MSQTQTDDSPTRVVVGVQYRTLESVCEGPGCSVVIEQPARPGSKRRYHSSACRQAAYRERKRQPDSETQDYLRRLGA